MNLAKQIINGLVLGSGYALIAIGWTVLLGAARLVYDLLSTMRALVDRGLSLLLVEQNVRATLELVDELYLLERGKVVAKGPAASMKDDPRILEAYLGSLTA